MITTLEMSTKEEAAKMRMVAKKIVELLRAEGIDQNGMALSILALVAASGITVVFKNNVEEGADIFLTVLRGMLHLHKDISELS